MKYGLSFMAGSRRHSRGIKYLPGHLCAVTGLCHFLQRLFDVNVTAYHVISGLTPYHQRRHTPDAVLRVQCRVDLHAVGHAILHQLQHRVSGGLHVVIDEPTQCRRNAVLPGFVQHPLQPLFRYREGDKVQRPFCWLFLIRRFLLADQIIDKLAV
jgi:hypothetical protein